MKRKVEKSLGLSQHQTREEQLRADPGWQDRVNGIDQDLRTCRADFEGALSPAPRAALRCRLLTEPVAVHSESRLKPRACRDIVRTL